jgi:hypothetical protein
MTWWKAGLVILFGALATSSVHATCNKTLYSIWLNQRYTGKLQGDPTFWRYQTQQQFQLKNGLALQIAFGLCKQYMKSLIVFKAGLLGPIDDGTTHDIMCHKFCMENDNIHLAAMGASGCSCLELSTQTNEVSFRTPGDWCKHNTGRLQCSILGFCGFWECRIDDFMCPRYEYNKRFIEFKGLGSCKGAATRDVSIFVTVIAVALAVVGFAII